MKAILVIDIDANELPKDAHANIYVFGKYYKDQEDDFIVLKENVPLKPMPEKVDNPYDEEQGGYLWDETYLVGYNDCLDDIILGAEE